MRTCVQTLLKKYYADYVMGSANKEVISQKEALNYKNNIIGCIIIVLAQVSNQFGNDITGISLNKRI